MLNKIPSHITDYFYFMILLIIFIKIVFKVNILLLIMIIVLIILFYNVELYIIPQMYFKNKVIKVCSHKLSHLGDHIFHTFLFNKLKEYIHENNITIEYYCEKKYHNEINDFKNSQNIKIFDFEPIGYHLNIANLKIINIQNLFDFINNKKISYDLSYKNIFNQFCMDLNLPIKFDNFYNEDDSLIMDYNNLIDIYKNVDILVINSLPLSNQLDVNEKEWDDFVIDLNTKYKIVTTKKVKDIPCTWDNKLTLKKIGAVSTRAKIIIAINTGPTSSIFNTYTINNCRKIYIFDNNVCFLNIPQLENIDSLKEINLENLDKIIKNI
jgi:hypothetical protein